MIVDDEPNIRKTLRICLEAEGYAVACHGNIHDALAEMDQAVFDLVLLDLRLGADNGMDYIAQIVADNPWTRVIVITAFATITGAVEAMKRGASDYLPKPFDPVQVQFVVRRVAETRKLERKIQALQAVLGETHAEADFPSDDPNMTGVLELARRVAQSQANLVIHGEVGVGKIELARAIHIWSGRAGAPLGVVSCWSGDEREIESELFGSPGTAATNQGEPDPLGKVGFCDGGTLVLDEVGELPMRLQPLLCRLITDKEYERTDDARNRRANVRVIATTSADMDEAVARGTFRADLLLALQVVQIDVPPLRNRPADIRLLAERFLAFFARRNHRRISSFTSDAMYAMNRHSWPGNTQELRNVVERAVLLCSGDQIGIEHLPPNLLNSPLHVTLGDMVPLSTVEELHILRVVANSRSLRRAAAILEIDSGTLCRRMKRYGAGAEAESA
jgi:NtrC-family two-component system response regulator AlgB